ncbi:hypothetical protein NY10_988 [Carnobacterium antarcticum]|nr:hypothetical protein NY10_988 [Carnobacterium sp. CP1]
MRGIAYSSIVSLAINNLDEKEGTTWFLFPYSLFKYRKTTSNQQQK